MALVLALPILWACFDDEMEAYMPLVMRNWIRAAYEIIRQLELQENPVKKVLLVVSGAKWEVHIDEIADMGELDGGNNRAQVGARNINAANLQAIYAQNMAL